MKAGIIAASAFLMLATACGHSGSQRKAEDPRHWIEEEGMEDVEPKFDAFIIEGEPRVDFDENCSLVVEENTDKNCPTWGYFFLRVLNERRLPVNAASLQFQPAVREILAAEDGYSGVLRPGLYQLKVSAQGYRSVRLQFDVKAAQKALLEIRLEPEAVDYAPSVLPKRSGGRASR